MSAPTVPPSWEPREAIRRGMLIALHAQRAPDRLAVIGSQGRRTFRELNASANRLARALRARGLKAGDGVALVCSNRVEFAESYFAALRSGLRITPINWHLTSAEIRYILENSQARAVLADVRFEQTIDGAVAALPQLRARLAIGGALRGFEMYEQALHEHSGDDLEDAELGSQMLYTSGTTGHPKGVFRRGPTPVRGNTTIGSVLAYQPEHDAHLCTGPLYHAAPLAFSLVGPLSAGVSVVLMDGWDPSEALSLIERHRVTHTHMVPTMFHRLLGLPDETRRGHDLSSLRVVLHGAAPCPVPVKQALMDWLGPIVYEYYAATEGFGSFVTPDVWLARPGTVGKPEPSQVKILDEDGKECPPFEVGKLYLRAPEEARFEYFGDQEKTRSAYHEDSPYFTLGDMGYMDEDGYLFLSDRSADLIISGGVNIYPAEVDAVMLTHPAIADSATVGIPNDDWGEEVRGVVTLRDGYTASPALEQELIEHCRSQLAHYKCPRRIDVVDALPRHDTGKIYRRLVRERYWQGRDRKI